MTNEFCKLYLIYLNVKFRITTGTSQSKETGM